MDLVAWIIVALVVLAVADVGAVRKAVLAATSDEH